MPYYGISRWHLSVCIIWTGQRLCTCFLLCRAREDSCPDRLTDGYSRTIDSILGIEEGGRRLADFMNDVQTLGNILGGQETPRFEANEYPLLKTQEKHVGWPERLPRTVCLGMYLARYLGI